MFMVLFIGKNGIFNAYVSFRECSSPNQADLKFENLYIKKGAYEKVIKTKPGLQKMLLLQPSYFVSLKCMWWTGAC